MIRPDRALCDAVAARYIEAMVPGVREFIGEAREDGFEGFVEGEGLQAVGDGVDDGAALGVGDLAEDAVLEVQPRGGAHGDEEDVLFLQHGLDLASGRSLQRGTGPLAHRGGKVERRGLQFAGAHGDRHPFTIGLVHGGVKP